MMGTFDPQIVVSDVRMPDLTGLDLLRELRARSPEVDVVLMTAFDDMATVVEAMKQGAAEFLVKPLDLDDLQRTLERRIRLWQALHGPERLTARSVLTRSANFGAGTLESLIGDARPEFTGWGRTSPSLCTTADSHRPQIPPNTPAFSTNGTTTPKTQGDGDRVAVHAVYCELVSCSGGENPCFPGKKQGNLLVAMALEHHCLASSLDFSAP
jgi:hypothetical protein